LRLISRLTVGGALPIRAAINESLLLSGSEASATHTKIRTLPAPP